MAKITPVKNDFFTQEVDFRSAVSEQLMTKVAQNVQFVHDRQFNVYDFKFFGPFKPLNGGEDGAHIMIHNIEIVGIAFRLRDCGSIGSTQIDLHKISSTGADQGSILSNPIVVGAGEANEKGFFVNFLDSTLNAIATSDSAMPSMSNANRLLNAGESLRCDVDAAATDARDLCVFVYFRPV